MSNTTACTDSTPCAVDRLNATPEIDQPVTPASFAEAEQLKVEKDPETDGGLVAPARDRAHAVEVEQRAAARGLRASSAKDSDGAWWIYVAPVV